MLKQGKLRDVMEPVPQPLLKPDNVLADISKAVVEHGNEFFYVSADGQILDGVVTMTDLLRARSGGATRDTKVVDIMTKNPVALAADDDLSIASAAMREYRLKSLPIVEAKDNRKLVGCLKIRRLMAYILQHTGASAGTGGGGLG
jgi:CBS domain-containing protein